MSGQQIGSVIGGAIGMFFGPAGVSLGMSIGGIAGNLLMPDEVGIQDQEGQRLNDLKVSASTYGVSITRLYGAYRIGGNTIWSTDIVETKHVTEEEVGKGGGSESYDVITYSYDVSFAVALCEGPVTGIRKVWADSVLIYDGNSTTAFYSSSEYTSGPMDFFLGGPDQIIDWSMQSYNSDTPAYRNVCYIRFNNLQLEKFGNRMPNITAEVVYAGDNGVSNTLETSYLNVDAISGDSYTSTSCPLNYVDNISMRSPALGASKMTHFDGYKTYISTSHGSGTGSSFANFFIKYTNENVAHQITHEVLDFENGCISGNCVSTPYFGSTAFTFHKNIDGGFFSTGVQFWGGRFVTYHDKPDSLVDYHSICNLLDVQGDHGLALPDSTANYQLTEDNEIKFYKNNFYCLVAHVTGSFDLGYGSILKGSPQRYPEIDRDKYKCIYTWFSGSYSEYGTPMEKNLYSIVGSVENFPSDGTGTQDGPVSFDVYNDTIFVLSTTFKSNVNTSNTNVLVLVKTYDLNGVALSSYDITQYLPTVTDITQLSGQYLRFYVADSYIHLLITSQSQSIKMSYGRFTLDGRYVLFKEFGVDPTFLSTNLLYKRPMMYHSGLVKSLMGDGTSSSGFHTNDWTINLNYIFSEVTLKTITDDLCRRSGLQLEDYDNSEGALVQVDGFAIINTAKPREAIASLQSLFLFDYIEDDFRIKLKLRTGVSSNTINEDDIVDGSFNIKRKLETELPRKVTINYSNKDFDYLTGSQMAIRADVSSDNNVALDIPLTIDDSGAKQLAEKILYSSYTGNTTIEARMPLDTSVNLSDVLELTYEGFTYTLRVQGITVSKYAMDLVLIQEGSFQYISDATGSDTTAGFTQPIISVPQYSYPIIFNAPTFSNDYINAFAIYYTAYGNQNWTGSQVYKSKDLEQTYQPIGAILNNTYKAKGTVITLIGTAKSTVWDLNDINVSVESGVLYSKTVDEVLAGENYIMIGSEVMQYVTATLNVDNSYTLSSILRGRRGTEWAIDTHENAEGFIFLDNEIKLSASTINIERDYRSVSFGSVLDDSFRSKKATYDGTNLKPFSPEYLGLIGLVITWVRRDRYVSGYFRTLPNSEQQEKYKIEFFYLDVSQGFEEVTNTTTYTYSIVTYPDVDKIQVSQYSDNLAEYGYIAEITV